MRIASIFFASFATANYYNDVTYNMIYTKPLCLAAGTCPNLKGDREVFPNPEERTRLTLNNIARLFPDGYLEKYGKYAGGYRGALLKYHVLKNATAQQSYQCGKPQEAPLWYWPYAGEAARFHAFSTSECTTPITNAHLTCDAYCNLFSNPEDENNCGMGWRLNFGFWSWDDLKAAGRPDEDFARLSSEGICWASFCMAGGHCAAIFDNLDRRYMAVGFADDGKNEGYDFLYVKKGPKIDFPVASVAHFDERTKVHPDDQRKDGKFLIFQAIYYHKIMEVKSASVYYKGQRHSMTRYLGDAKRAVYELAAEMPNGCEPYYFEFETTNNTVIRMPEDNDYFFGTAWSITSRWNPTEDPDFPKDNCKENHYYRKENGEIAANAGPEREGYVNGCVGCSKVALLKGSGVDDSPSSLPSPAPGPSPSPSPEPSPAPAPAPAPGTGPSKCKSKM